MQQGNIIQCEEIDPTYPARGRLTDDVLEVPLSLAESNPNKVHAHLKWTSPPTQAYSKVDPATSEWGSPHI